VPLASDKTAAQTMLNDRICKVERTKAGLVDPADEQRKRPLREHLADFKRHLTNKGITTKQVTESTKRIQKIVDSRKFKLISDLSADEVVEFLRELRETGKSAQTHNNYLASVKQFSRWLVRDRRIGFDSLAHISGQNVRLDRRHDRRALSSDEFNRLIQAARSGKTIEAIAGPDRAMLYVLAAWTGFRKGELGSLTLRSFHLDDEPATATVAACYSKRRRQDSQVLHPAVAWQLKEWLATKPNLQPEDLLFPVSGRVPGGTERKTNKMMRLDLRAASAKWINESQGQPDEMARREKSEFLSYKSADGLFADFHSNRHMFITSLEQAGLSPKMAQTLARHSDVRLTLGVYTHIGLHDQTSAIESLPAPPSLDGDGSEAATLRATGTDGRMNADVETRRVVPPVVLRGAQNGALRLASGTNELAPDCTGGTGKGSETGDSQIVVNSDSPRTFCTALDQSASRCTAVGQAKEKVHPTGLEPVTFGSVDRCSIQLS
jgi:integrase/recombinase XerD